MSRPFGVGAGGGLAVPAAASEIRLSCCLAAPLRMEDTTPGEVAELDFGRLGLVHDPDTGRRPTVWALIVVLGYSRHCFVWPTFSQKLEDVIAGLEAA